MRFSVIHIIIFIIAIYCLAGCSAQKPFHTELAQPGIVSKSNQSLTELPAPQEQIVAAVYRFRDQTGQYKPSENIASWSTAVTQGATSILIKSMEDSGWFIPIEREGLSNLLNERQIIQQIRQQNANGQPVQPLPPLLFAGIVLEGGIIGYDTNIMTGGIGARYLGTGGQQQFRKDQITIYIRAVSTQSGRILKTVHTSKSLISYQMESGAFRYIDANRLLEAEAGYTYNEPPVLAVTEAIDEALRTLILEGIDEDLWSVSDTNELAAYKAVHNSDFTSSSDYFGLNSDPLRNKGLNIGLSGQYGSLISNYNNPYDAPGLQVSLQKYIGKNRDHFIDLSAFRTEIGAAGAFREPISGADLLVGRDLLTGMYVSPFIALGSSLLIYDHMPSYASENIFITATLSGGINYRLNDRVDLRLSAAYRYLLNDGIDGFSNSTVNDQFWNFQGGLIFKNIF